MPATWEEYQQTTQNATQDGESVAHKLVNACKSSASSSRAVCAFLIAIGERKAVIQPLGGGCFYTEICPAYLTSCDGVTSWSARTAWKQLSDLVGWYEATAEEARELGAELRQRERGRRYGRHLILSAEQLTTLRDAHGVAVRFGVIPAPQHAPHDADEHMIKLHRLPQPKGAKGARTVAASCPLHDDKHPSLVLWRNANMISGGGLCMSCRSRFAVRYVGTTAFVRPPLGTAPQDDAIQDQQAQKTSGPVGGLCVSHQAGGFVSAKLSADKLGTLTRSKGRQLKGDPISVLKWSDARSKGEKASENAAMLALSVDLLDAPPEAWSPTQLLSVSRMTPDRWTLDRFGWRPEGWKPLRQDWILIDIDDVGLGQVSDFSHMTDQLRRIIRRDPECSGRCAIVQTGPVGLQIWVELRESRKSPSTWHRLPEVVEWYETIGNRMLRAVRRCGGSGGYVDLACCAAGRFARRPGWRVLDDGTVWRTRLLMSEDSRVRGRSART